ncbi:MAG: DEAD/DEAH box helicase [Planctomycetes bacterium]|nr:DEAD/DEAH box helicase [Planctomycetota bacterium]
MGLSKLSLEALHDAEYLDPTPVQIGLIPPALEGKDVIGQAQTGTGKTAAYVLPILEMLADVDEGTAPVALVLVPTRELAVQSRNEFVKLAENRECEIAAIYGGKPIRPQSEKLRRGVDVVVGTPGRIIDHIGRGTLRLDEIQCLVLDEADRMLDIGFRPDIEKILRRCPKKRQTLLLSATVPPPVLRLAQRYMIEPLEQDFSPTQIAVETIDQLYFTVDPEKKFDLLVALLRREDAKQAIIFCRTKRGTDKIFRRLSKHIKDVSCIHGDLQQRQRDRVMEQFRAGRVRHLVATDVVGRGIDVTSISHIINYDIPQFCDDYVHRVGRTGRMGREGIAYTFVTSEEGNELTRIEIRINQQLRRDEIPGFVAFAKPEGDPDAEDGISPAAKPVYGKRNKRFRRAL